MLHKDIEIFLERHEEEALELLKQLAQMPAPSHHEEKRAQFCMDWLKKQGAEGVYMDQALNVIYPIDVEPGKPLEVYAAHTDVVFPDEGKLPLEVKDGRIYCPGVGDDTACLVCLLLVAKYIAQVIREGRWRQVRPQEAPGLLLVCDASEEGLGNLKGMKEICRVYGDRMQTFCTFDETIDVVLDRAVGSYRYRVKVKTQGGHSFEDFGRDNAIEKLAKVIERLYSIQVPEGGNTTYNVGSISGGTTINSIAHNAEMLYEFRSDVSEHMEKMEQHFLQIIREEKEKGLDISYEVIGIRPCGKHVDAMRQQKLVKKALRVVEDVTGQIPVLKSGSTDCNVPLSLGIPSVCVGCYEGKGQHTREEYVEIESLKLGYRVAFEMILG